MPPVKKTVTDPYSAVNLADIPFVYLLDRSQWTDFKRALNNCGLTWNIPDWMMTIVYKGPDWMEIAQDAEEKVRLETIFVSPTKSVEAKQIIDVNKTSTKFMRLLGYPKTLGEYIQPSSTFCNLKTLEYEPDSKLPARQKFWTWIVNSLHGPSTTPGPYHYLRRAMRRLEDLNERLPEEGKVLFSEAYLRTRIIRAARQITTWSAIKVDELCARFESVRAQDASFASKRTNPVPVMNSLELVSASAPTAPLCTNQRPWPLPLGVASSVDPKIMCRVGALLG